MVLDFSITDLAGHQGQRKHFPWWLSGGIAVPFANTTLHLHSGVIQSVHTTLCSLYEAGCSTHLVSWLRDTLPRCPHPCPTTGRVSYSQGQSQIPDPASASQVLGLPPHLTWADSSLLFIAQAKKKGAGI